MEQTCLSFVEICDADVPALTAMMARAFDRDFALNGGGDPAQLDAYHTSDFFYKWPFGCIDTVRLKIVRGGATIGAVVIWRFSQQLDVVGMIFVDPDQQDHGLGAQIWRHVEALFPDTACWMLSTPRWSAKNHYFYERRCGFQRVGASGDYYIYTRPMEPPGAKTVPHAVR